MKLNYLDWGLEVRIIGCVVSSRSRRCARLERLRGRVREAQGLGRIDRHMIHRSQGLLLPSMLNSLSC